MVKTLAKHNKRAMSAMAAELVEEALKLPKYRAQLQEADIQVPIREDTRGYKPRTQVRGEEPAASPEMEALAKALPELNTLLKALGKKMVEDTDE